MLEAQTPVPCMRPQYTCITDPMDSESKLCVCKDINKMYRNYVEVFFVFVFSYSEIEIVIRRSAKH